MNEQWKIIEFAPKYLISNFGNVKSLYNDRLIKQFDNGCGYIFVVMKHENKRYTRYVHRLVAEYFCEKTSEERNCVNHIDGNKRNNSYSNLEFCTYKENVHHAIRIGKGTKGNTKIPIEGILEIYKAKDSKLDKFFAGKYGVGLSAIRDIRGGRTHAKFTKPNEL